MQLTTMPQQQNYHDCGPFIMVYAEYFMYNPPRLIHFRAESQRSGQEFPLMLTFAPNTHNPNFFRRNWFKPQNPANLRGHMLVQILGHMINNKRKTCKGNPTTKAVEFATALQLKTRKRLSEEHDNLFLNAYVSTAPS